MIKQTKRMAFFFVLSYVLYFWAINIFKLARTNRPISEWGAEEATRVIGIFIGPIGAAMGLV